ncbi:hypothetical protein [Acinetobacter bereziniae]|uniref:hypothetical protein n=1 Tax=Acinetobacter bereziniae TaxID=106648 RepID=UPI0018DBF08A|nr:hypothetical protein [Acinetobacter bereziniae]MBI0395446.1 hypothetical protein [Acinetobacter bereziniae]
MPTCCPYCQSTQVHRIFVSHQQQVIHLFSNKTSISKLGLATMLIKRLSSGSSLSPWMLKLAEVILSGLIDYLIELRHSTSESGIVIKFYCESCHRSFNT